MVICPAFTVDCLETIEEIGMRAKRAFLEAGGAEFTLIPCLNDHPAWVEALARMTCDSAFWNDVGYNRITEQFIGYQSGRSGFHE